MLYLKQHLYDLFLFINHVKYGTGGNEIGVYIGMGMGINLQVTRNGMGIT